MKSLCFGVMLACLSAGAAFAATTDDLVFIHHSVGQNWLASGLDAALVAKTYIDERNDIYYGTDAAPDTARPDSLATYPGDSTDMNHWVRWFNDYLGAVKSIGCASGVNRIVMFKSCYPNSNIVSDGLGGDPFSATFTLANFKAVYRHPSGPGNTYSDGGYTYRPLEAIFAANPNTMFLAVTAPPRNYAPSDATNDAEAHRARLFNDWLKSDWVNSYQAAHPGLHNVAVFDLFNVLAYPDNHATHPNRLKAEYGGTAGDSHPNSTANSYSTQVFATNPGNFIDQAWALFSGPPPSAVNDSYQTASDGTLQVDAPGLLANDTDQQGDRLWAVKLSDCQHGTLSFAPAQDGAFTYTPVPGFAGTDSFTYKASDGTFDSNVATVEITVVATTYVLTVNSGLGDGAYEPGQIVNIEADPPASGMAFGQWAGDGAATANPYRWSTELAMPARNAQVTATYQLRTGNRAGNDFVGQADLNIVLSQWGRTGWEIIDPRAEANGDGFVGQADLDLVLRDWGKGWLP